MSSTTLSSYMSLPIPTVGVEAGPAYATDINTCMTLIDQHNHTSGSGQLITPSAMNINANLSMGGYSLTSIKSLVLAAQSSIATALALYVAPGGETVSIDDLWFNDGNGTAIQITKAGLVNATIGSLAGQSYAAGTFVWKQGAGSTTPAYFDIASITLRPATAATTYGTTIQPNASIASSFTLTLPNNPSGLGGNSFLTMDASGNITANALVSGGLTTSNLSASAGITGSQIAAATITNSNIAQGFGLIPVGTILSYGGATPPSGYLTCDGSSVLRASYADLYTAIGNAWGTADGTHFNIPDLRGYFLRGVSGTTSNDPNKATRTAQATGGNTGNNVGSIQTDDFKSHAHNTTAVIDNALGNSFTSWMSSDNSHSTTATVTSSSSGGNETRPLNAYVIFIIKT